MVLGQKNLGKTIQAVLSIRDDAVEHHSLLITCKWVKVLLMQKQIGIHYVPAYIDSFGNKVMRLL